jgi:UDP-glucose 4-epimerase
MGVQYKITRAEVDSLATQWCQAKHIVVMLDDVSKNFAMDVANKVLQSFIQDIADRAAAKKAAAKGEPAQAAAAAAPEVKKSSIILTD